MDGKTRTLSPKEHDEKLRALANKEENKYCFECRHRGTVCFVDTTVSLICTHSMELPHRVKSIPLGIFTEGELKCLANGGNKTAGATWMVGHDDILHPIPNNSDHRAMRLFLQMKYGDKRWHASNAKTSPGSSQNHSSSRATSLWSSNPISDFTSDNNKARIPPIMTSSTSWSSATQYQSPSASSEIHRGAQQQSRPSSTTPTAEAIRFSLGRKAPLAAQHDPFRIPSPQRPVSPVHMPPLSAAFAVSTTPSSVPTPFATSSQPQTPWHSPTAVQRSVWSPFTPMQQQPAAGLGASNSAFVINHQPMAANAFAQISAGSSTPAQPLGAWSTQQPAAAFGNWSQSPQVQNTKPTPHHTGNQATMTWPGQHLNTPRLPHTQPIANHMAAPMSLPQGPHNSISAQVHQQPQLHGQSMTATTHGTADVYSALSNPYLLGGPSVFDQPKPTSFQRASQGSNTDTFTGLSNVGLKGQQTVTNKSNHHANPFR